MSGTISPAGIGAADPTMQQQLAQVGLPTPGGLPTAAGALNTGALNSKDLYAMALGHSVLSQPGILSGLLDLQQQNQDKALAAADPHTGGAEGGGGEGGGGAP